jgi:hypothetical protein
MPLHRFAVGEAVLYTRHRFFDPASDLNWKSPFTVVAYLSSAGLVPQYRIRSAQESCDRVAGEHELSRTPQPQRAFLPLNAGFFEGDTDPEAANLNLEHFHSMGMETALVPRAGLPRAAWHKNDPRRSSGSSHA